MNELKGKHIILGICGGIAAYKSVTLLRLLTKMGAEVQVVMTPAGKEFITPVTLSALSQKPVISEFFTANTGEWHSHVDLGLWADLMVIAPATACTIAKMAHGVADNMLVTTYLSARCPVWVYPAMDVDMMNHPSTRRNLQTLRSYGDLVLEPTEGELASGLIGKGRMQEPEVIAATIREYFCAGRDLEGVKILITAGPTVEKMDPVRYISNFSTGKMGYALVQAAVERGAEVTLITGPVNIPVPDGVAKVIKAQTACQMMEACKNAFSETDIAIMCAAVADYRPQTEATHKIKREKVDEIHVKMVKNPDIAATLGQMKTDKQILVGFALETDNEVENATQKLEKKHLDMIVLNSLKTPGAGFGTDTNEVSVITKQGVSTLQLAAKQEIARKLISSIVESFPKKA